MWGGTLRTAATLLAMWLAALLVLAQLSVTERQDCAVALEAWPEVPARTARTAEERPRCA